MRSLTLYLAALACASPAALSQTGTIRGTVASEDGKPIPGAVVAYTRIPVFRSSGEGRWSYELAPGETYLNRTVSTEANGEFVAGGLPAGKYLLCVEVANTPFLNPCKWSVSPSATLIEGGDEQISIVLKRGVFLKVRVDDPLGLLPRFRRSPLDFPHLTVGVVFGRGAFLAASEVNVDNAGRDFRMAVPEAMPLQLSVASQYVMLKDSLGASLDSQESRLPFQAAAAQDQAFRFSVSGARMP